MDPLKILGRKSPLFVSDMERFDDTLTNTIRASSFLVLGGAGTIGQAVTKEIFARNPLRLHIVDISENNLVELVRDLRSSDGYISGEFQTYALDIGSPEFDSYIAQVGKFDYVLNLSALKHVRSERDPYTLMRMVRVNILNAVKAVKLAARLGAKKYFCVSTDKATNPVNMMGASKQIMELFLSSWSSEVNFSTARFANVAFSDGSLLHGFERRLEKNQPIVIPNKVRRYFISGKESGQLCLLSCILGANRDIFFPKLKDDFHLTDFKYIAEQYLKYKSLVPIYLNSEEEARIFAANNLTGKEWPCYCSKSDTTGEKEFEEFFTSSETIDYHKFDDIGIIKPSVYFDKDKLDVFENNIEVMIDKKEWKKIDLVNMFQELLPEFEYNDVGFFLDDKM